MWDRSLREICSRRCSRARRSRNSTTSYSRPAKRLSSSSKRILTRRSALQMKSPMKSRPGKKKQKAEDLEEKLPSNCLLLQLYTERYLLSTWKCSSWQISSLECFGYSEPRCSSLVKSTQAQMGIYWTPTLKYHVGSQTANVTLVQERIRSITDWLSYWGFKNGSDS